MNHTIPPGQPVRLRFLILASFVLTCVMVTQLWAQHGIGTKESDPDISQQTHFIMMLIYISVALVFSFMCSVAEAVALSITPSYLAKLKGEGNRSYPLVKSLKGNIDRSLAAILTLNTIAHTIGAGGGRSGSGRLFFQM